MSTAISAKPDKKVANHRSRIVLGVILPLAISRHIRKRERRRTAEFARKHEISFATNMIKTVVGAMRADEAASRTKDAIGQFNPRDVLGTLLDMSSEMNRIKYLIYANRRMPRIVAELESGTLLMEEMDFADMKISLQDITETQKWLQKNYAM